jgi:hypothetical protein
MDKWFTSASGIEVGSCAGIVLRKAGFGLSGISDVYLKLDGLNCQFLHNRSITLKVLDWWQSDRNS